MKKLLRLCIIFILIGVVFVNLYDKTLILDDDEVFIMDDRNYNSETFIIDNIATFNQYPNYPTGCESVALYLLLDHYDIDVTVDDIISVLRKGPLPYVDGEVLNGATPEREFVGNPYLETSYGVF